MVNVDVVDHFHPDDADSDMGDGVDLWEKLLAVLGLKLLQNRECRLAVSR